MRIGDWSSDVCSSDLVLDKPDDNFWMAKAYTIPDTPHADMRPGQAGVKMVPINRMVPRSFVTNLRSGMTVPVGQPAALRGIAFGGDTGVAAVELRSEEHTSELQSLMRISYAVFCL